MALFEPSARGARRLGLHRRRCGELAELRREERARERARRGHGQTGRAQGVGGVLMALVEEVIRAPSGEEAALADLGHWLGAGDRAPKVFPEPGEALGPTSEANVSAGGSGVRSAHRRSVRATSITPADGHSIARIAPVSPWRPSRYQARSA